MPEEPIWNHAYAHVNNLRIHYVTAGDGPLMLMLHGFPEFWYSWRHQIPVMAKHFRVVVPDMRGFNQTEKPKGVAHYRLGAISEDLEGLITHLGETDTVLVGHDWGAGVAWHFAAHYPQMVNRLIILDCPSPRVFIRHLRRNPVQMLRSYYIFLFQYPFIPEMVLRLHNYQIIDLIFRLTAVNKAAFNDHDIAMFKEAAAKPGALTGGINYYRAFFRLFLKSFMPGGIEDIHHKVKCPTLVIWGEKDVFLGKELTYDFKDEVEERLETIFIPKCGHWVQQEEPDLVNSHILDFLSDVIGA